MKSAVRHTFRQWLPTAGAVVTFVLAGQVLAASGAAALLESGAMVFGNFYPAVSPLFGSLGGALGGSNALFMPLTGRSGAEPGEPGGPRGGPPERRRQPREHARAAACATGRNRRRPRHPPPTSWARTSPRGFPDGAPPRGAAPFLTTKAG